LALPTFHFIVPFFPLPSKRNKPYYIPQTLFPPPRSSSFRILHPPFFCSPFGKFSHTWPCRAPPKLFGLKTNCFLLCSSDHISPPFNLAVCTKFLVSFFQLPKTSTVSGSRSPSLCITIPICHLHIFNPVLPPKSFSASDPLSPIYKVDRFTMTLVSPLVFFFWPRYLYQARQPPLSLLPLFKKTLPSSASPKPPAGLGLSLISCCTSFLPLRTPARWLVQIAFLFRLQQMSRLLNQIGARIFLFFPFISATRCLFEPRGSKEGSLRVQPVSRSPLSLSLFLWIFWNQGAESLSSPHFPLLVGFHICGQFFPTSGSMVPRYWISYFFFFLSSVK